MNRRFIPAAIVLLAVSGCTAQRKIAYLRQSSESAQLSLAEVSEMPEVEVIKRQRDTLLVEAPDGHQVLIMKAIKDDDGEMVATDVLDAAVVTARFRNVAERNGLVDIAFDVTVPKTMQDSRWQLRLFPTMEIMGDTLDLDPVIITGREFRKSQLRGYEQYERFISRIITDPEKFINKSEFLRFLQRNMPDIYAMKNDSSYVSDEEFASHWGITEQEALDHYTRHVMKRRNDNRAGKSQKMYNRFIKVPILQEGIRLDTVVADMNGDFVYGYTQTINARVGLRKVDVTMSGEIYEQNNLLWRMPTSQPLTFYISSLSSLVDEKDRFLKKVVERRAEASTSCRIDFESGQAAINPAIGENAMEISRIQSSLRSLLENREFDLDSIVITATSSPEGSYQTNRRLAQSRSRSVSDYFERFIREKRDSLRRDEGIVISLDDEFRKDSPVSIGFVSRSNPENWDGLKDLIEKDSVMTDVQREKFTSLLAESDPDARENLMKKEEFYPHVKDHLYPRLRSVRFDFHLHRKGMVKDTIHTTVLDSTYMRGVQAIKERDYHLAVTLLRPYADFNTAVAYCSLEYNASALEILKKLEPNDKTEYMSAILYSRSGDDQKAVQHYMNACNINPTYIHRGNLDPEISSLIKRYNLSLNQEEDGDEDFL